jgi:hypothetical protein
MLDVGFPYNLDRGKSRQEAQALYRRIDHFFPERSRGRRVGALFISKPLRGVEHPLSLEVKVWWHSDQQSQTVP